MAIFDIGLRSLGSTFQINFGTGSAATGSGATGSFNPPTTGQIYPREFYVTGSHLYATSGQMWPRGSSLSLA